MRGFPGSSHDIQTAPYRERTQATGPRTAAEVAQVRQNEYTGLWYVGLFGRGYKTREAAEAARTRYLEKRSLK